MGVPQQQLEYSDWWGQVEVIGGGGLLPVYWDSVTGKEGGGGGLGGWVRGVLCSQWSAMINHDQLPVH